MSEQNNIGNNKRIAKNTLFLYLRMIFLMVISLYTSRVTLQILGVEDYGLYNVVGGIVSMFTIFTGSLSGTISRYLTFEIGREDIGKLKRVFSTSIIILAVLSFVIFLLIEPIGIWYVQNKLVVANDRIVAAHWVLQCAIVNFLMSLNRVPYNSAIIAHEKMGVFAYISIFEGLTKLLILYVLWIIPYDHLVSYAILYLCMQVIVNLVYFIYCKRNFAESSFHYCIDKELLKNMSNIAGWSLFGIFAWIINTNGLNLVLNLFFGPVVNAARGIAVQVQTAITNFYRNFQTALNPQITKTYAIGNIERMHDLVFASSRYSFYLLFIFALPFFIEADMILNIWLVDVPEQSEIFLKIILLCSIFGALSTPFNISALANGRIKNYQILVETPQILVVPISYILFMFGHQNAVYAFNILLAFDILAYATRVFMMKPLIGMSIRHYTIRVVYPILKVCIPSLALAKLIHELTPHETPYCLMRCLLDLGIVIMLVFLFGLSAKERKFVLEKTLNLINRK